MGLIRLGLIFLGIGTSLFLWEEIFLGLRLVFQAFPQMAESLIGILGFILGSLFTEHLDETFQGIGEGCSRLLMAFLCLLRMLLIGCGLALGYWEFASQNQKWKHAVRK